MYKTKLDLTRDYLINCVKEHCIESNNNKPLASYNWLSCKNYIKGVFEKEAFSSEEEQAQGLYNAFKLWLQGLSFCSPITTPIIDNLTNKNYSVEQQEEQFINNAYRLIFN